MGQTHCPSCGLCIKSVIGVVVKTSVDGVPEGHAPAVRVVGDMQYHALDSQVLAGFPWQPWMPLARLIVCVLACRQSLFSVQTYAWSCVSVQDPHHSQYQELLLHQE